MSLIRPFFGRGVFPARLAWFLEGPWRRFILSPRRLRQRLPLAPHWTVLELGVGGGYYAGQLAPFVRRLIGLDVQAGMLRRLRQRHPVRQLLAVQGNATQLPVADSCIDLVLAVTVLGEIPSPEAAIAEARRVLRPNGLLAIAEHWPDPDFLALPFVIDLCRKSGLQLQRHYGRRSNYTAIFLAAPRPSSTPGCGFRARIGCG